MKKIIVAFLVSLTLSSANYITFNSLNQSTPPTSVASVQKISKLQSEDPVEQLPYH
ncbi:hypothetical protein LCO01nite_15980 [Lapidilactobacillus concavus]|nr:hypothetical protein LCO01nite_15980 [Lapidilactobacillus concavus]